MLEIDLSLLHPITYAHVFASFGDKAHQIVPNIRGCLLLLQLDFVFLTRQAATFSVLIADSILKAIRKESTA
jgi:hypothetical protein